jgi:hypothetical protein
MEGYGVMAVKLQKANDNGSGLQISKIEKTEPQHDLRPAESGSKP